MKRKRLFLVALSFISLWGFCDGNTKQEAQIQGVEMNHTIEHQKKKFFIGLELRTNNEEFFSAIPAHKEKFFKENIPAKIPNKINGNILIFD